MDDGTSPSRSPRPSRLEPTDPGIPPPSRVPGAAPVIVTAMMGAADQRHFDRLRTTHYPPERNHLPAHITLFHQLPPSCRDELNGLIRTIAADTPPPAATVRDLHSLGRGVAFRIESPELLAIRTRIADRLHGALTAQDRGMPRLHITIQNKVAPEEARVLLAALTGEFRPHRLAIIGLAAHLYRGGPWEPAFARNFRAPRT